MTAYSSRDVARILELSVSQVRSYAQAARIQPQRGLGKSYRFGFQDLVLLRAAKGLIDSRIPPRRIRLALRKLKDQLPSGRPLTQIRIAAVGDQVVAHDGHSAWHPESGQTCFDFDVGALATKVAPLPRRVTQEPFARRSVQGDSEEWFQLAMELETSDLNQAREAYYRAIAVNPVNADAHVNLGRLLHETRQHGAAEAHYRLALSARAGDPTAYFNMGVLFEDMGRRAEAIQSYEEAITSDPWYADAYFNLARLYQMQGDTARAILNLTAYHRLTRR